MVIVCEIIVKRSAYLIAVRLSHFLLPTITFCSIGMRVVWVADALCGVLFMLKTQCIFPALCLLRDIVCVPFF
jgi:hypothetical protein